MESEGAWAADDEMALSDDESMSGLETVLDSSSECFNIEAYDGDWFSEVEDDASKLDDMEWKHDDLPEEALIATTSAKPGQYSYM